MDEIGQGIITRVRPLTETSQIVQWISLDHGRISTVAKSARKSNSPFRGKIDLFFLNEFSFRRNPRGDLHQLKETKLLNPHSAFRSDYRKLTQACYAVALVESNTERETPIPDFYELLFGLIQHLQSAEPTPLLIYKFELNLLELLGLFPNLDDPDFSAVLRRNIQSVSDNSWNSLVDLHLGKTDSDGLRSFLQGFLMHHLTKLPPQRAEALKGVG